MVRRRKIGSDLVDATSGGSEKGDTERLSDLTPDDAEEEDTNCCD